MKGKAETRTHGYGRKSALPAMPGKPKLCTKCDLWFLAAPRERVCFDCLTPAQRALKAVTHPITRGAHFNAERAQVTAPKITLWEAIMQDRAEGISQACKFPSQGQAEIVPSDRTRRHPVKGDRPQWSGFCVVQCNCRCHVVVAS